MTNKYLLLKHFSLIFSYNFLGETDKYWSDLSFHIYYDWAPILHKYHIWTTFQLFIKTFTD